MSKPDERKPGPLWTPTAGVNSLMNECQRRGSGEMSIDVKVLEGLLYDSLIWRREREEKDSTIANAWLLFFEDPDHGHEVYIGEGAKEAAFKRYDQARTQWSCHLFERIRGNKDSPALPRKCPKCERMVTVGCNYCACPFPLPEVSK